MNKLILFGLLAVLINSVFSLACRSWDKLNVSLDDLDEDHCAMLSPESGTHCCLFEVNDAVRCDEITDDEYENIGRYIDYWEDINGTDIDVDCSSKFISLSLFAILALLF